MQLHDLVDIFLQVHFFLQAENKIHVTFAQVLIS